MYLFRHTANIILAVIIAGQQQQGVDGFDFKPEMLKHPSFPGFDEIVRKRFATAKAGKLRARSSFLKKKGSLLQRESLPSPKCGDVITEDSRLQSDLDCDCGELGGALLLEGPASLDLNGYTLSCKQLTFGDGFTTQCVRAVGDTPTVFSSRDGGTITNCGIGVFLGSVPENENKNPIVRGITVTNSVLGVVFDTTGSDTENGSLLTDVIVKDIFFRGVFLIGQNHVVRRVQVSGVQANECLLVSADNSVVSDSVFRDCASGETAFGCLGAVPVFGFSPDLIFNNKLINNRVEDCNDVGISIFSGNNSVVARNQVIDTASAGMVEFGFTGLTIKNNIIKKTAFDGIRVGGNFTKIIDNYLEDIGDDAIQLTRSGYNVVRGNRISDCNDQGIGTVAATSDNNKVANNVIFNCKFGVYIEEGSSGNVIKSNKVIKSSELDLVDLNEDCEGNTWKRNFGRSNQTCAGTSKFFHY